MTKKKTNYALWTVICLVSILAVGTVATIAFVNNSTVPPTTIIENGGGVTINNPATDNGPSLGAVTSPVINERYLCVGGICTYYLTQTMNTATTTLCSFATPVTTATSTLVSIDYQITTGTTTAATIVVNPSSLQYASSTATNIGSVNSVASGATDTWSWNQNTATMDIGEVSPNEFVLVQTEGAGLSGYTYTGTCQAIIRIASPLY
jgi:hypothetical protein